MSADMAGVQARIAQIQGQFAVPVGRSAPPSTTSSSATAFSTALATSSAQLARTTDYGTGGTTAVAGAASLTLPTATGDVGARALDAARSQLGTPYLWGGSAPGGFDCSGLLQWAYDKAGVALPRTSNEQKLVGTPVSPADARPGDLVFFERGAIDHIGMYAGGGTWIVAPKTGDVVKVQGVDLSKATTIRRIGPSEPTTAAPGTPFAALFAAAGARHGVSPALLTAVARAESGFDPGARSPAGAQGLMQFMPATAREMGVNPLDPASAVDGAARLLKQHLQRFGSTELALAAYNAGPRAVTKHGGIPPYRETQDYVAKIVNELRTVGR